MDVPAGIRRNNPGQALLTILTGGRHDVHCDTCGIHITAAAPENQVADAAPLPARYVHLDGTVVELDHTGNVHEQYAAMLCPHADCPRRVTV